MKYLRNFWRTIEVSLFNSEINLILNWSANCVIAGVNREKTLAVNNANLYVPFQTLSIHNNVTLLDQLKSDFKITINWKKMLNETVP